MTIDPSARRWRTRGCATLALLALGALGGCASLVPPRYRGPVSDHFDGKRFHNYVPPARVAGAELRVTFVNHSTVLIQMDSLNILTDPVWSKRVSPVSWTGPKRHRPPGIRFEDLPPIDLVVISHNHYDHMDLRTLRRLAARFHPRIVAGLGNAKYLADTGVPGA